VIGNLNRSFPFCLFDILRLQLCRPFGVDLKKRVSHTHENDDLNDLYDHDARPHSIDGVTIDDESASSGRLGERD